MNHIRHSMIALAVLAVFLSFSATTNAHAQNATGVIRHHDRDFFGPRFGLGGLGLHIPAVTIGDFHRFHGGALGITNGTPSTTTVVREHDHFRPDFARFHDWAFAHRQHFIFLQNRYVLLPETVGCPPGSQLNLATGECVIIQPTIIQQAAPTILSESVATPPTVTAQLTTTQTVAPTISCPAGSTLQADNTCTVTTTSEQQVQPIITCPAGTSLNNNQCVEVQQQITVDPLPCPQCPAGSNLVNGACVVSALPSQVVVGTTPNELVILGNHYFHHGGPLAFLR